MCVYMRCKHYLSSTVMLSVTELVHDGRERPQVEHESSYEASIKYMRENGPKNTYMCIKKEKKRKEKEKEKRKKEKEKKKKREKKKKKKEKKKKR